jgi:hypothetical protein
MPSSHALQIIAESNMTLISGNGSTTGYLVTVALDGDVRVYDHVFDMAGALLELVVDGLHLVFSDVVVDVEVLFLFLGEGRVEFVGDHFVGAALEGEEFTL